MQPFMRRIDIGPLGLVQCPARDRLQKIEGIGDRIDDVVVFVRHGRMADPVQVPELGVVQVGETTVDQRADEIER